MTTPYFTAEQVHEMIAKAVAEERERCAKVCQSVVDGGMFDGHQQYAAAYCRDAIREGSNHE